MRTRFTRELVLLLCASAWGCSESPTVGPDVPDVPDVAPIDVGAGDADVPSIDAFETGADGAVADALDGGRDADDGGADVRPADAVDAADATPDTGCAAGEMMCGSTCTDTVWNPGACGACGVRCAGGEVCNNGRCQTTCDAPRALCVAGGLGRCQDLQTDAANCGDCGRACGDGETCMSGRCGCPRGFARCATRCSDTSVDPGNCGACGVVCPATLNGRAVCNDGLCGIQCATGYHRCGNSCVDDRAVATCGTSCTPCPTVPNGMATCDGRSCGAQCATNAHLCAGACVLNSAPATCGTSCTPCPAPMNGTATCNGTACGVACNTGFHLCDTACVSNTALTSCGTGCTPCATRPGAVATCDGRACGFTCNAGLGNCDGDATNGCETDVRVTAAHCGACGRPCATVANATSVCVSGACGFTCATGYADCDRNPANGCETDVRWGTANCGACGRTCGSGEVCSMGMCRVPATGWAKRIGDVRDDGAYAATVDPMGNVIVAGRLVGPTRVGDGMIAGGGGTDAFVASLRSDNSIRWARSFGGSGTDVATGAAADPGGSVVVVGTFSGTVDFGRGAVTSMGDTDVFIVSLTPEGVVRWVRTFGAEGADTANAVAVDTAGVYVTGSARNGLDFGGGFVAGTTSPDPFVMALGPDGSFRWVRRYSAVSPRTGSGAGFGVAVGTDGGVVATGYFQGAPTFGGDVLASAGNFDLFVVSLTAAGAQRWSKRVGAASADWAQAVTLDANNNVYITGYYQGAVDFGGGLVTAPSGTDGFVASYTGTGSYRWVRRMGGATGVFGNATGYGLSIDPAGNVVVGGSFSGNVDFGGGFRASAGNTDAFLASYTAAGAHRWSRRFGGDGADELRGVAVDRSANVYAGGFFEATVDFGVGALVSAGLADAVVLQFVQ